MNLASSLTLYSSTSLTDAMNVSPSTVKAFFEGKAFSDWKKGKETELKLHVAVVNRLNEVIRASGIVAKTVARTHG